MYDLTLVLVTFTNTSNSYESINAM